MPTRKPTLLNPPVTTVPTDLLDALVSIFGDSPEVTQWATPTLVRAWRYGAIDRVQWDGRHYIPQNHVGENERTFSITGYGIICELGRCIHSRRCAEQSGDAVARMKAVRMIAMLSQAIGIRREGVAA